MRVFAAIAIVFASLSLAGCEGQKSAPPADNKGGVEVHAPGVDVKAGQGGVDVNAPNTNVDIEKKK